ncbi:hypothetical protein IKF12_02760 [Candidatus Saccharibacteria bacterium]|nr:hypothetical protein [Candidatus Saccharibacteria bacterium]
MLEEEKICYSEGVSFAAKIGETDATIIINGLSLKRHCLPVSGKDGRCEHNPNHCYDVIARIWSTLRDTIKARYSNDSGICVYYDLHQKVATCKFYLNTGLLEDSTIGYETYKGLFQDTFRDQATMFEDAIIGFLDSDAGYQRYLDHIKLHPDATDKELDGIIDAYLISAGFVKPKKTKKPRAPRAPKT